MKATGLWLLLSVRKIDLSWLLTSESLNEMASIFFHLHSISFPDTLGRHRDPALLVRRAWSKAFLLHT